jgi:hypothetical protein
MAILYTSEMTASGITYGRRRGYIKYSVNSTSTTTTVTIDDMGVAYYTSEWADTYTYGATGTLTATCGGTSVGSKTTSAITVYCTTTYKLVSSGAGSSVSYTRGTSNVNKTLTVSFATSFANNSPVTGSVTITVPKKAEAEYILNYNANGGWAEPDPVTYTASSPATVNVYNQPARLGYQFLYWTANKNGSGTKYYPGDTYSVSGGGTIYAQWAEGVPLSKTRKFIYIDGEWYPVEKIYVYNSGWQDVKDESRLYSGSWLYV